MEAINVIAELIYCNPFELMKTHINNYRKFWDIEHVVERTHTVGYVD